VDPAFNLTSVQAGEDALGLFVNEHPDARAEAMITGLKARSASSVFVDWLENLGGHPSEDAVLAAITTIVAWGPMMRKRISRLSAENLPGFIRLIGCLIGASVPADQHAEESFCGLPMR